MTLCKLEWDLTKGEWGGTNSMQDWKDGIGLEAVAITVFLVSPIGILN
jgi:hypothetical protein